MPEAFCVARETDKVPLICGLLNLSIQVGSNCFDAGHLSLRLVVQSVQIPARCKKRLVQLRVRFGETSDVRRHIRDTSAQCLHNAGAFK